MKIDKHDPGTCYSHSHNHIDNDNDNDNPHQHNVEHTHRGVTSKIHDGALVCSGDRNIFGDLTAVKKKLTREVGKLAEWVEENKGIIGHIKGLVDVRGSVYMVSTTGGETASKEMPISNITIYLVAIVFNIDMKKVECRMASLLDIVEKDNDVLFQK